VYTSKKKKIIIKPNLFRLIARYGNEKRTSGSSRGKITDVVNQ
jgi:hypothetical protein